MSVLESRRKKPVRNDLGAAGPSRDKSWRFYQQEIDPERHVTVTCGTEAITRSSAVSRSSG